LRHALWASLRLLIVTIGAALTGSLYGQPCKAILALVRGEFPDKPALIALYNQYTVSDGVANCAGDIGVSFPGRSALDWVDQLQGIESPGGKQTAYFSLQGIADNIGIDRARGVEWIFYDLEGGLSPSQEVNDPINAINTAAQIVHQAGLKFAFTVVNVGRHPREIIPFVVTNAEGYNPQGQSFFAQGCNAYASAVGEVIVLAKQHNPSLLVWAQGSLRWDVATNQQCIQMLETYLQQRGYTLDGVTLFYGTDTAQLPLLNQFYRWYFETYRSAGGDVDGNGCVDDADLLTVLFNFGATGANPADVNCDAIVDDADLLIVLFNFGSGC